MVNNEFRIATFNLENLDMDDEKCPWAMRLRVLRPMLKRLRADVLFLQEVHNLDSLDDLLKGTIYSGFKRAYTRTKGNKPYKKRNLVILSRHKIVDRKQYLHKYCTNPMWRRVTARPPDKKSKKFSWERPILHCQIELPSKRILHAINLHLKSKMPSDVTGQKFRYTWASHEGWAEGFFISTIKRVGQALETRILLETIFQDDPDALIAVCGDFNAEIGSVPFQTIIGSVQETNNPALQSTVMLPCEYSIPPEQRYSLFHRGQGLMLDHVIVSQALYPAWTKTDIYNEFLPDESLAFATDKKFPNSDHAPIIAHFRTDNDWYRTP